MVSTEEFLAGNVLVNVTVGWVKAFKETSMTSELIKELLIDIVLQVVNKETYIATSLAGFD